MNRCKFDSSKGLDQDEGMKGKGLLKWLGLAVFALLFVAVSLSYLKLRIQLVMAREQIKDFKELHAVAQKSDDPSEVSGCLLEMVRFYPSGTKQEAGSSLDRMVELSRESYEQLCIERLRKLTKKDLGNDPKAWIDTYRKSARE